MPGKVMRRRRVYRKRRGGRKPVHAIAYARRVARARVGGFFIHRKLPLITMVSSAAGVGTLTLNDPTGTCVQYSVIGASPGTTNQYDVAFSLKFALNQLQQFTDITQIADQYKIQSVLVKVMSGFQMSTGVGAAPLWIEYAQDHDDAAVPSLALMRAKMATKSKWFGPTRTLVKMGVRPRTADEIFNNGVTTAYGVNGPQWINSDYPAVEHYAIKGIIHNAYLDGTANKALLTFDISFNVAAKDLQ